MRSSLGSSMSTAAGASDHSRRSLCPAVGGVSLNQWVYICHRRWNYYFRWFLENFPLHCSTKSVSRTSLLIHVSSVCASLVYYGAVLLQFCWIWVRSSGLTRKLTGICQVSLYILVSGRSDNKTVGDALLKTLNCNFKSSGPSRHRRALPNRISLPCTRYADPHGTHPHSGLSLQLVKIWTGNRSKKTTFWPPFMH